MRNVIIKSITKPAFCIIHFIIILTQSAWAQTDVPTSLSATNETSSSFILNWTAPTGYTIQGYNIYKDNSYVGWANGAAISYQLNGISQGVSHDYVVKAIDGSFNEHASAVFNFTLGGGSDTQAPTAPTLTSSNVTENSVTLSWSGATDNVGVTGYKVYQDASEITNLATSSYQVTGLTTSTSYAFTVLTYDAAGNQSVLSNTENVTTSAASDTQAPSVPNGLSASNETSNSFALNWNASSDNIAVTGYKVYLDGVLNQSVGNTGASVSGLSASTNYSVTVLSLDAAGNESAQSAALPVTTTASSSSDVPTNLHATNETATSFTLNWTAPTNYTAAGYNIYLDSDQTWITWINTGTTSYTIDANAHTSISPGVNHDYLVIAYNPSWQPFQATFNYTIGGGGSDTQAPTAPTLASSNVTQNSVDLSWSGATDNIGVTGYKVYQNGTEIDDLASTSKTVSGLTSSTAYAFTIRAYDAAGNQSVLSNTENIVTQGVGSPVIIAPTHPKIAYVGRLDSTNNLFVKMDWPGSGVRLKFQGSSLKAKISSVPSGGSDYIMVVIDGSSPTRLQLSAGGVEYTLASGLDANQSHTAEVYKLTDATDGYIGFEQFVLDAGKTLEDYPRPTYKIEFYGDSQTVGYAMDDPNRDDGDSGDTQYKNNYMTYGGAASRALDAEYHTIARTGIAIKSDPYNTPIMPSVYHRTLHADANVWDFSKWKPDLIVINLGQNDHWNGVANGDVTSNYENFVNTLRTAYGDSNLPVVLSLGDMDATANPNYVNYIQNAATNLGANTYSLIFPNDASFQGHPNQARAQVMANALVSLVQTHNLLSGTPPPPVNQIMHEVISNWEDVTPAWVESDGAYSTVSNPESTSDNNSASCGKLVTNGGSYPLLKLEPGGTYDFSTKPYFRMKINGASDRGLIMLKFENPDNSQSYYKTAFVHGKGETGWEELIFDMSGAQSGVFTRMVILIDLGDYNGTNGDTWYIDEIERFGVSGDTQVPSVPSGLSANHQGQNFITVEWDKSADNSQVASYEVHVDGNLFTTSKDNSVLIYDLLPNTAYNIQVKAVDMAGNKSTLSSGLTASTIANPNSIVPDDFNYILGTQTFKPNYQFTDANGLIETANGMIAMGSNILKMTLQPGNYIEPDPGYVAPMDAINNYPFLKEAMDMPQFKHIFLWVYSPNVWVRDDGMRSDELANEDNTVYALTKYLLQQYNGTDKTFYIGQWEADWELVNDVSGIEDWNQNKPTVDQHRIDGMIAQINARQAAVDRAKGEGGFSGVQVYNYTEVNLPKARSLDQGLASMLSHVLPHVNVDFVSYSCYDAIRNYSDETTIRQNLMTVMDTLQNALPAKAGLPFEKRVFVGEFGFPNGREDKYNTYAEPQSQEDQDLWSRYAMKAAIEWGSPFALYWTFYGNEHKTVDGVDWNTQNGYWMIDNINRKQKIYHTYKNYYAAAKQGVADFMNANSNSLPSEAQFRTIALNALNGASNTSSRNFEEERKVLAEEKPNLSLRVYPNPVTDQFFISNHSLSISSVHLFDLSGNKILTASKFNQGVIRLDVSALKKGIYLLKATTIENTISTIKIMKK